MRCAEVGELDIAAVLRALRGRNFRFRSVGPATSEVRKIKRTLSAIAEFIPKQPQRELPEWYAWLTIAGSVVFLVGALSLKTTGFFSVTGGMSFIAFFVFAVWVLVSSVLLVQKTATATMGAPATSPM